MCTAMRSVVHQLGVILLQKTFIFVEECKECIVTSTNTPRNIKTAGNSEPKCLQNRYFNSQLLSVLILYTSGTDQTNQQGRWIDSSFNIRMFALFLLPCGQRV